ncbi:MAG: WecB/TagA/CpsF family glycosyltransferase [Gemmatimonadota bacterium]
MSGAVHPPRVPILGVHVSAIDIPTALATIEEWIAVGHRDYVCVSGVHGVMESSRDPALLDIHNAAGLVTPDGMPLVWICHWRGHPEVQRVYGPDLMLRLCERSEGQGYRHFLYGGAEGVADLLAERLKERFPGLEIVGTFCPPFRPLTPDEDAEVVERIRTSRPHVVWVGLSTPKQERWMHAHVDLLEGPVLIGVGAAFDFHAGLKRQAPGWMQRTGLEWLFRLLSEPRRLGRRYLVNNPLFIWSVLREQFASPRSGGRTEQ